MKLALQIQTVQMYPEPSQEGFQAEVYESVDKTHAHTSLVLKSSRGQRLPSHCRILPLSLHDKMQGLEDLSTCCLLNIS